MITMDRKETLLNKLVEVGFIRSDAQVYMALLKMKIATPTTLSRSSKIARPRVYDSLKRLENKGLLIKDTSKKIAKYVAISPDIVFKNIQEDFEKKITLSRELKEDLQEDLSPPKKGEAFVFKFDPIKIHNLIVEILRDAKQKLYIFLSDFHTEILSRFFKVVYNSPKFENLSFSFFISSKYQFPQEIASNIPENWKVNFWPAKSDIPFGLIMNDVASILLIFQDLSIFLYGEQDLTQFESFLNNILAISRPYSSEDITRENEFKRIIKKK